MGKKGKNKNQTTITQNVPTLESASNEKDDKPKESLIEKPIVEQLKPEPEKVENTTEEGIESNEGTLKSKKRRNRKKKTTDIKIEELNEEKSENVNQKEELKTAIQVKPESVEEKDSTEPSTDTLKKKRRRNKKKNVANEGDSQEENIKEAVINESPIDIASEKLVEDKTTSQPSTLKRKRNRNNKNKSTVNNNQNESVVEAVEQMPQKVEAKSEQKEKPEPQRRGKKQKRFDLSSKKTILDELQERQEREQKEARDHIKKEIAKREKLLETIDLVLDCHKSEVELAKSQQESLKDVKLLSQEAAKPLPQPTTSSSKNNTKQSSKNKKPTPVEEELTNKIEQVLGMTKLEIKNAQTQQAYVNRLEAEVAKVKQSKDILLGGQASSAVPTHIQKMAKEMKDLSKGEVPKTKEELIKEIESRDVLMSEINRVLDNTKSEIDKVQKQQKIIQNLEVELNKMKEQEIVEKLMILAEEEESLQEPPPSPPKQSPGTASLLDALMANVGKLKEIQAMKEKQKANEQKEQTPINVSKEIPTQQEAKIDKSENQDMKIETVTESTNVAKKQEESKKEKSKSPQKDSKQITNEKKQPSPENSPKEQKKHPKDQKKPPQKVHESKHKAVEIKNSNENEKNKNLKEVEFVKEECSVEAKKEQLLDSSVIKAPESISKKTDNVKLESTKEEKLASPKKEQPTKDHIKDKESNKKEIKSLETVATKTPEKQEIKNVEQKFDAKNKEVVSDQVNVEPKDVKAITSSEPIIEPIKNETKNNLKGVDQKKNNKEIKTSPKNSHKNKKHEKKDVSKGVPEVISPIPVSDQKPSMADMLKNAPDPPPEEINKKQNEDIKIEAAPLARPESAIIEVKPSEQIKEAIQPIIKESFEEKKVEKVSEDLVLNEIVKETSGIQENDEIVIVNKEEVEAEIKEEKLNEQDLTDPKNVQRGGFVSPVEAKDTKPLKKDEKQHANKTKSPIKTYPPKPTTQKGVDGKALPNKTTQRQKVDVQSKINSKPTDAKKIQQSPTKPLSPSTEKLEPKFESANAILASEIILSPNTDTQNLSNDNASLPVSTDKPKVPPRPDVTKTSNTKPAPKAGNVTNQTPIKTKTPSPSKSPSVSKTTSTSPAPSQLNTAKPKPTVSRQSATSKPPINTKSTNQKPLVTPQKVNSTKTATSKPSSSMCDSVFRLRQQKPNNLFNKKSFSQPAFRINKKMDEESMNPIKRPLTTSNSDNNTNQMKALLTKDGTIKIILPSTLTGNLQDNFFSKDATSSKNQNNEQTIQPIYNNKKGLITNEYDDGDQYLEYKITPKQIFCASICQVCKVNLSRYFLCNECRMVAYCKEEHMKIDYLNHKGLCMAIQLIAKRRGGHVYNMANHLTSTEFRNLRLHTIYICEQFLNRTLLKFEREIFLFPRLCHYNKCREWKTNLLNDCGKCGQISFCAQHPLNEDHKLICSSYALFQRILLHEKSYGNINITLPQKVLKNIPTLTENVQDILQLLYKNVTAFQDECINAALMQIVTAPLTTFYSIQKAGIEFTEQLIIHFVGAEMKFEGDRLEKWESFFLHLAHGVNDLQIIFIGSELNYENLPVEIIARTRVCKICRQNCCGIRFDFQCKKFYHDYCESSAFVKPDFICLFNPALHRPGFCGFDTWPKTIEASLKTCSPILVTSMTENECYLDLSRIKKITNDEIEILIPPLKNPYASTRPERNFASDDQDAIMFKNNYLFVIVKSQDLIDL